MQTETEREFSQYLQPTYQTILINGLNTILTRLLNDDQFGAYQALGATHTILPKKVKEDIKEKWDKFINQKNAIIIREGDFVRRSINQRASENIFLRKNNPEIFEAFIESLETHKYLRFDYGVKPQNPRGGHFG